ncbi:acyl-CoA dehydrogenase family protein [Mycolicibacterium litorale]|nr:acyl-CoA dehydrogenase family protein [Mycolicibacterium litorale]MCV7418386.1 acyl-CoA/acyl-ACP dehydrogenase [Mycolicibacterium litorale]TDY06217.1 alkylation response protein AidB-like acyl-CoA dehydrogenase [Mycolicibacterium litorale]
MTGFREFHDELRSVAGDLLAKDGAVDWPVLAGAGWTGLEVPEHLGGAGATFAETAVICAEIGRAAGTTDHLGSAVLAVGALNLLTPSRIRDELLAGTAAGTVRSAVVIDGFSHQDGRVRGRAEFVPDAVGADRLLLLAGDVLVEAVPTVTPQPVLDETRRLAVVTAAGVEVTNVLPVGPHAARTLRDRAAVAIACDSLGLAEAMLSATVEYAKVRHQFGRPIGSFQAVKHACADMLVQIEVCRQLVEAAVDAVATDSGDVTTAAAMAKSHVCSAAVGIAGKAMQLHGGIGYTWESGIHVYLKRAALNRSMFGSPAAHRRQLARRYGN